MARYRRGRSYRGRVRRRSKRYAKRGRKLRAGKIGFRM